jgi:hypothetical protein
VEWQLVGVFAEVVGAVAVVVTILFLVVEIKNSRNATQSNSLDVLTAGFSDINYNIIGDSEFAAIWETGLSSPDKLDSQETIRLSLYMQCYMNHYTALWKYHELGVLPNEAWQTYLDAISGILNTLGGQSLIPGLAITPALLKEIRENGTSEQKYGWLPQEKNPPNERS